MLHLLPQTDLQSAYVGVVECNLDLRKILGVVITGLMMLNDAPNHQAVVIV